MYLLQDSPGLSADNSALSHKITEKRKSPVMIPDTGTIFGKKSEGWEARWISRLLASTLDQSLLLSHLSSESKDRRSSCHSFNASAFQSKYIYIYVFIHILIVDRKR